jgi:transposase
MAAPLVSDDLWSVVAPLLPPHPPRPKGGRPPIPDRACLTGIVFVLRTGIQWEHLPQEMGCGSGMTCWRRLRDWQRAGVFSRLQEVVLARLQAAGALDWSRAVMDASLVRAKGVKRGGEQTGPNSTDRARPATKRHLLTDRQGIPLAELLTPGNRNEITVFATLLDAVPPVRGKPGRPRRRPAKLHADKAYDFPVARRELRRRGITARIARRGIDSSATLGRHRWVVEQTFAHLNQMRRLAVRYERRADIHTALLTLGCALLAFGRLGELC